ncbi:MAG: spirocyclase AveC family protein [Solirubrobacteraceae bacterium]
MSAITPAAKLRDQRVLSTPAARWATAGAVLIAVEVFLLARWVTGPDFVRVPTGANTPPVWMRDVLNAGQVVFPLIALALFYRFLWLPWRREGTVTIDGILCVGFLLAAFFDPLSNYAHNWWGYNSYLLNFGSVMTAIPGGSAGDGHGVGQAFSILLIPGGYVAVFVPCSIFGCWVMRRAKARWPALNAAGLIAICLLTMMAVDILVEGMFFLRLGFWSYAGGHGALLFPSHYYKYPLQVLIGSGIFFSVGPCIRYFVNDRGETIGERGLAGLRLSPRKRIAVRFLAVIATLHIALLLLYHVPQGLLAEHPAAWPKDALARSYFTHGACGPGLNRRCR